MKRCPGQYLSFCEVGLHEDVVKIKPLMNLALGPGMEFRRMLAWDVTGGGPGQQTAKPYFLHSGSHIAGLGLIP